MSWTPLASRCTALTPLPPACATSTLPVAAASRCTGLRFEDAPAIAPNYLSTAEDQRIAAASLQLTRRIVASALAPYQPEEVKPGVQYQRTRISRGWQATLPPPSSTPWAPPKWGADHDPMAVVDSQLRVRDGRGGRIAGLRVVDAGVMPTITSGNTNSPR